MLDRVQGMIEKLKYLNRKILEIDKKQSLLVEKEELLEKNLEQIVEKVIVSVDQMKQLQNNVQIDYLSSFPKEQY